MRLDALDLIRLHLPLRRSFVTATGVTATRPVIVVRAAIDDRVGWGEAASFPGHTSDSIDEAWSSLLAIADRSIDGSVDTESIAPGSASRAALDGALVTLRASRDHKSLGQALGAVTDAVKASASIGLHSDVPSLLTSVSDALDAGYRCLKVKIARGRSDVVAMIRRSFPEVELGVDANGSFTPDDLGELRDLDAWSVAFIEQPYPVGRERESAELAALLQTPVALDESIRNLADVKAVLARPSVDVLTLKPARLGVTDCLRARDLAVAGGVAVRVGGMLESGVGRAIGAAIAACAGFTVFGDISASGWHYLSDLTVLEQQSGVIHVPSGDGLGLDVSVDQGTIVDEASFTWPSP